MIIYDKERILKTRIEKLKFCISCDYLTITCEKNDLSKRTLRNKKFVSTILRSSAEGKTTHLCTDLFGQVAIDMVYPDFAEKIIVYAFPHVKYKMPRR